MNRRRDILSVAVAVTVIHGIGGLVIAAVVDARSAGRSRLGQLETAQVSQLARSMDAQAKEVFSSFQGLVTTPYNLTPKDPTDTARLAQLQGLNPKATTGLLLVDKSGTIVNGTLLRDPSVVGTKLHRPGLAAVIAGKPAFLSVGPGLTTALPTIALAFPLKDVHHQPAGAFIVESEVSPTSQFNAQVAPLASTKNAEFAFVDSNDTVVASNRSALIGHKLIEPALSQGAGLHRAHGMVVVDEPVPSAGWVAIFRQPTKDFEGSLTGPLRSALVYVALLTLILAGIVAVVLLRRLARSREEQRRLRQISAEREEFISIVSHELRTPVSGLLGFLQTTLDHWEDMDESARHRAVSRAWANASRLYSLSRDVLDSSSLESGHMTYAHDVFDLRETLRSTSTAAQELASDRPIALDAGGDPIWIEGDPERMHQVLSNLLDNATKASPPDGPIVVDVERLGDRVQVTIRDSGPGLSPEDLDRAFEKFVRGRGSRTVGSGLGLYICRQIVEAHGGQITAANAPVGGAIFTIDLPTTHAPTVPTQSVGH